MALLDVTAGREDHFVQFFVKSVAAVAETGAGVVEARGIEEDAALSAAYVETVEGGG